MTHLYNSTKLDKDSTKKGENYNLVFFMNTDTKVLNKILAKRIQLCTKIFIYHDQMGLYKESRAVSIFKNQSM